MIMPGFNGTGPQGMGPMTGRMAGPCAGNGAAFGVGRGGMGRGRGAGAGFGQGRGRGRGFGGFPASFNGPSAADELTLLRNQASGAEQLLQELTNRINQLEKQDESGK